MPVGALSFTSPRDDDEDGVAPFPGAEEYRSLWILAHGRVREESFDRAIREEGEERMRFKDGRVDLHGEEPPQWTQTGEPALLAAPADPSVLLECR
jgi:hypothetical protein